MRGALTAVAAENGKQRIIPADAGSTFPAFVPGFFQGDHPRGCGEHVWGAKHKTIATGSSPRMRGARFESIAITCLRLIIPADAGSTQVAQYKDVADRDHPRGCGEHLTVLTWEDPHEGSSPRMRGAR